MQPLARLSLPVDPEDNAVMLLLEGSIDVAGVHLAGTGVAAFPGPEDHVEFTVGPDGASMLVLIGTPIAEPVLFGGPFCMTTAADLDDARQRFTSGAMGQLSPSF